MNIYYLFIIYRKQSFQTDHMEKRGDHRLASPPPHMLM